MRKILIVIDMQNDFIDAALGTKEAVAIVDAVKAKIRSYPVGDVIATMDTHGENYMETQEGKYLPVPHCIKGSEGWQIRPDIAELLTGAKIYEKPTFGSVALAADLKAIAEKYMCDPRTVRIFLMLNKNSSEIILPAKEEFFEALENFRDPNKSIYRDEFEDFLNTTYGEMDEEEEEREPDW